MNCDEVIEALADYIHEDRAEVAEPVRKHLHACPRCAREASSLRSTCKLLDRWAIPDAPLDLGAIHGAETPAPSTPGRRDFRRDLRAAMLGAAAAALLGFALLGPFLMRSVPSAGDAVKTAASESDSHDQFLLLLLERPDSVRDPARTRRLAAEYRGWAQDVHRAGRAISGAKLTAARHLLSGAAADDQAPDGPTAAGGEALAGYFRIAADSFAEALEIARTCPHLKHGGRIEVRRIDPRTHE